MGFMDHSPTCKTFVDLVFKGLYQLPKRSILVQLAVIAGAVLVSSTNAWAQKRVAFVAGVERYSKSGLKDLEYAEDDAREVKKALDQLGFKTTAVIGEAASLKNLNKSLDEFIKSTKKLDKTDIAIVYLSGHGVQKLVPRKTADGRTIEIEEPFFCPNDAIKTDVNTLLTLNAILKQLEDFSGSDHNIIMLDACRDSADKSGRTGGIDGSTINGLSNKMALFFAAKSGHRSYESKQLGHGIFTHYLLEGLRGQAADSNDEITFLGLVSYVSKQVERSSPEMLEVSPVDAQRPNLMGNLSGTIVLGQVSKDKPAFGQAKTFTNSLGMKLVRIEASEFMMGNEESVDELIKVFPEVPRSWFEDESPSHLVRITCPYYLGAHEVTLGQFRAFVKATGYKTSAETDGQGGWGIDEKGEWSQSVTYGWRNAGFVQNEDHPVANLTWNDAVSFCDWLSQLEGKKYRLPTEAEWEYACRAGTRTRYWHGDAPDGLAKIANVPDRAAVPDDLLAIDGSDGYAYSAPVGSFPPNPWGLYDMHGNVSEWCSDWWGDYPKGPAVNPQGPTAGSDRVARGGGWNFVASTCRSAARGAYPPGKPFSSVGFRLVHVPPDE
jgi:sulfatase modifying factor 1